MKDEMKKYINYLVKRSVLSGTGGENQKYISNDSFRNILTSVVSRDIMSRTLDQVKGEYSISKVLYNRYHDLVDAFNEYGVTGEGVEEFKNDFDHFIKNFKAYDNNDKRLVNLNPDKLFSDKLFEDVTGTSGLMNAQMDALRYYYEEGFLLESKPNDNPDYLGKNYVELLREEMKAKGPEFLNTFQALEDKYSKREDGKAKLTRLYGEMLKGNLDVDPETFDHEFYFPNKSGKEKYSVVTLSEKDKKNIIKSIDAKTMVDNYSHKLEKNAISDVKGALNAIRTLKQIHESRNIFSRIWGKITGNSVGQESNLLTTLKGRLLENLNDPKYHLNFKMEDINNAIDNPENDKVITVWTKDFEKGPKDFRQENYAKDVSPFQDGQVDFRNIRPVDIRMENENSLNNDFVKPEKENTLTKETEISGDEINTNMNS